MSNASEGTGSKIQVQSLLKAMVDQDASDLHILCGAPPGLRVNGQMVSLKLPPLSASDAQQICYALMSEKMRRRFELEKEIDFAFGVKNISRFRANIYVQRGSVAAAIRRIPNKISAFDDLGLPPILKEVSRKPRGLILVTGPTGSGKTTTIASLLDLINSERRGHIMTIEDPIEYIHTHKLCSVSQREIGSDTESFAVALRYVLRQDPDVVLIGEMRDLEAIDAALTIGETGHLALATLHTNSAVETINRVVDAYPPHQHSQVRVALSFMLEAVVCQNLIPGEGGGRAMALEVMIPTPAIRNLIRDDKVHQIYSQMQMGRASHHMCTMNQALAKLVQTRKITLDQALWHSIDEDELRQEIATQAGQAVTKRRR